MPATAKTAPAGYSVTQISLHWIVFLLIGFQLVFDEDIGRAWRAVRRDEELAFNPWVAAHVYVGIAVLVFALWRIFLRARRGAPQPPEHEPAILKLAAGATHLGLYALLLLIPLSGLAAWFGNVALAGEAHELMKPILIVVVLLHIAGALYHQFVLKTDVMIRMRKPQA